MSTLRKKILAGYGAVLALVAMVCVWAVVNLQTLGSASDRIMRENYKSILAAESMIDAVERQDSATLLLMLGYEDEGVEQFKQNEAQFLQWLARAKDNVTIRGEAEAVEGIDRKYAEYLTAFAELRKALIAEPKAAAEAYHEQVLPRFRGVRDDCARLREMNQETMVAASERARAIAAAAIWSTAGIGAAAVLVGLVFSLLLTRRLVRPLREMTEAASRIAGGDYDIDLSAGSGDELGALAAAFLDMSRRLRAFRDLNVGRILAEKRRGEAIIRSVVDGIVVVDHGLRVIDLNPEAERALGTRRDEAEGRHFLEVVKDDLLFERMKAAVASGAPATARAEEAPLSVERGGSVRHFRVSVTPARTAEGQVLGAVLVLQDVTRLTELDRMKSEFVMTASHELKTPLTSMILGLSSLAEGASAKLAPAEEEILDAAREEAERMRELIEDLLNLSKIESGRMEMAFEPVEPALLLEKAASALRAQAEEKGIELSDSADDGLPAVRADPNKITWVLTNLIGNALRYTHQGGHIRLSAGKAGRSVHVAVADDGEGIPLEYQSRVFQKFVQVKDEKVRGGSGLGLALCKEIVKAHGGAIWVDSTPGKGSTFTFTLSPAGMGGKA